MRRPTQAHDGPDAVLAAVAGAVREACDGRPCAGLAVGLPGIVDPDRGVVATASHLPGFDGLDVRARLSALLGCPVAIQNDARLAGYAEWQFGAGRGVGNFVYITVGTGIGGCIVLDGELLPGGEVGHMPAWFGGPACDSGHPGCLEAISSGTAISRRATAALAAGTPTVLHDRCSAVDLTAEVVQEAAVGGDALATLILKDAGLALGYAVGGLVNLLAVDLVVIGGGVAGAGELFFAPLRDGVQAFALRTGKPTPPVVQARLGGSAGLAGAVAWAVQSFDR